MASLPALAEGSPLTAAVASQISDGASATLLASELAVQADMKRSSGLVRACALVLGVLATGLFEAGPARAQSIPDCRNYVVTTGWGKLTVDTRPSNDGDPVGVISWAWFINVQADVPGRYDWTVYINGAAPEGPQWNVKDDNLHSAFRRYRDGVTRYTSGDVFHVEAAHAAGKNLYVTPLNRCRVP